MRHEVVLETVRDELAVVGLSINAGQKCCQNSTSTFLVDPHRRTNSDYREHGRSQMAGLPVECGPREGTTLDKNYHVQAAAEIFSANNTILGDRKVHVAAVRQRYFFSCHYLYGVFGCGPCTVYIRDLHKMDVACRGLRRKRIDPPVVLIGRIHGMKSTAFGMTECQA